MIPWTDCVISMDNVSAQMTSGEIRAYQIFSVYLAMGWRVVVLFLHNLFIGPSFCHARSKHEAENSQVEVQSSSLEEDVEQEEEEHDETEDNCSKSIFITPPPNIQRNQYKSLA